MRCVLNRFLARTCVLAFALAAAVSAKAQADFKGFYVGANAGGAFGRNDAQTTTTFSPTGYFAASSVPAIGTAGNQKSEPNQFTGGGQAGVNFQSGNFVFGLEGDFGAMSMSASTTATATYPCCAPTAFTVAQTYSTSKLFTLRPRVGWVFGNVLIYETVGMALTTVKYSEVFTDTFATAHESASLQDTRIGWTIGGGGEIKIARHWSVKGEYLYADFGSSSVSSTNLTAFTPPIAFPTNTFNHTIQLRAHIARAGLNFRF
jgi:outer membrane immunogenic protein